MDLMKESPEDWLSRIDVASPCPADWNEMKGDHQVRFCGDCRMNVYNLSGMTASEAKHLIQTHEGRLCVRFYRRADGTLLTRDCPVDIERRYRRKVKWMRQGAVAAVVMVTALGSFTLLGVAKDKPAPSDIRGEMIMGDVAAPPNPSDPNRRKNPNPAPMMGAPAPIMGKIKAPNPGEKPPEGPKKPCPTPKMGRPATR